MTEEQIQKYEKWLDDNSTYDVILSAEILADLQTLQQQNKQLIDELKWIMHDSNELHIVHRAQAALQLIQGVEES